jgi:hypothetical protein
VIGLRGTVEMPLLARMAKSPEDRRSTPFVYVEAMAMEAEARSTKAKIMVLKRLILVGKDVLKAQLN